MATAYFPEDAMICSQFLRHKTKLINPSKLRQHGIRHSTVLQYPGEIVITFPGAYHAGFNHGFNIAEATNFATPQWLDTGRRARPCVCRPDSVRIDVLRLETLYLRQLRRIDVAHTDASARLRCRCGQDRVLTSPTLTSLDLFCCRDCGLWNHVNCVPSSFGGTGTICDKAIIPQLCYLCTQIVADEIWYAENGSNIEEFVTLSETRGNTKKRKKRGRETVVPIEVL
jgi:hypothetical protein